MNNDQLILSWQQAQEALNVAKERESALRDEIVKTLFPTHQSGTATLELGKGYKLKCEIKTNYTLGKAEDVKRVLSVFDPALADVLVKWKPDLSVSTYKNLDDHSKALLNEVLVTKPAKPTVELVAPKTKEA